MTSPVLFPVQVLRTHVTALEAALSVCLADPDHRPVHKLRTETRRVEALLLLLAMMPDLPEHRKQAEALLRALRKLRRAAGEVRNFDVHRKLLEELETPSSGAPGPRKSAVEKSAAKSSSKRPNLSTKGATEAQGRTQVEPSTTSVQEIADAAAELRKSLHAPRDTAAKRLLHLLDRHQARAAKTAEALLDVLEPATEAALPLPDLLRDAEAVLMRDRLLRCGKVRQLKTTELHSVRKSAKAARYLAESLPDAPEAVAAAQGFEHLQEAGGQWHDCLELAQAARRHFGRAHLLTSHFREERDRKLEAYQAALEARVAPPKPVAKRRRRPSMA